MAGINSEDMLVQATFAAELESPHGWDSVYAMNEVEGDPTMLGRTSRHEVVLTRDVRAAVERLNPGLPPEAVEQVVKAVTAVDASRSMVQHNQDFSRLLRDGVPARVKSPTTGEAQEVRARVIDFRNPDRNRFLAVRELWIKGLRTPEYTRRADLVLFVNGLPLVFIELKAVYLNIREGFEKNLTDYKDAIPHAFHHNAFLIVSNGDKAKYGSITAGWDHFLEWKRNDEKDKGSLDTQKLIDGMLAKDRLLDIVENFILFDSSKAGPVRKIVARNHQVLGVNNAVASVLRQEELKKEFPPSTRLRHTVEEVVLPEPKADTIGPEEKHLGLVDTPAPLRERRPGRMKVELIKRVHPDLGRLGVFWHTQGSGKSYSMAFFAEKVRRTMPGNFTFLVMTDREDLDKQIYETFSGCGVTGPTTPRVGSGDQLRARLKEDHRYIFSLIHKFNQDVREPYSERDDIIVLSDEAHRTQSGTFATNMRRALPNASFLGFTGTPLFKHDEITKRIFGGYISRYDFKRSEEDGSTVKLIYENRGEKLGIAQINLNDEIQQKIDEAALDPDQEALIEKLLGKDYEVLTADERLIRIADDFVEHYSTRWQSGKAMLVCIDKVTCGRMLRLIQPRWQARAAELAAQADVLAAEAERVADPEEREHAVEEASMVARRAAWMGTTQIHMIVSEAQNEVKDFAAWGVDIRPHRELMKKGFPPVPGQPGAKHVSVEDAFKDDKHPFRVAIVCAMWLTGFDVESLSTLYIDKPMKGHTLMQAIARANRVYPGKEAGLLVGYSNVLRSLNEAMAQYALESTDEEGGGGGGGNGTGGEGGGGGGTGPVTPIAEMIAALQLAIEEAEAQLLENGFDVARLRGSTGFVRITAFRDAVEALYTSDAVKRRFEITARHVFACFKAVITEPSAFAFQQRYDDIRKIYQKLNERRDNADVVSLLKELHRVVNEAITASLPGADQSEGITVDLSQIDFERLRQQFAKRASRPHTAIRDIRDLVEARLQAMLQQNPSRMDYYERYQEIIAAYNREKDRATIEETFARLLTLAQELDAEARRAVEEGLTEEELALFDLLYKESIAKAERERVKQASRELLASVQRVLGSMQQWTAKEQTQAEVETYVLDQIWRLLPDPPYTTAHKAAVAAEVYKHLWRRSVVSAA